MPSLERKLRKNAPCLNQSAISNFALYVISVEIDQVNILITCNALINSIGNKTLCVEAKKFLRYCAYSLNRPIKKNKFLAVTRATRDVI